MKHPKFTDIPQLPAVYTLVQSNSASWGAGGGGSTAMTVSNVTATTITLALSNTSNLLTISSSPSAIVIIPTNIAVNFTNGSQVNITRFTSGAVRVSAAPSVYVRSADNRVNLRAQYSTATVIKLSANDWLLFGDIS